jgi:hypothetical protein
VRPRSIGDRRRFHPVLIYFDSSQSQWAMELFQFTVAHDVFFGGGWRGRLRVPVVRTGSEDHDVISFLIRVLCVVRLGQLYWYPPCTSLYLYTYLYSFLI